MKPIWFLLWAVVTLQIAVWSFAPTQAPPQKVAPAEMIDSYEQIHVQSRLDQRKDALSALERPWGARCNGEGRKQYIAGLNHYYYQRQNQTERYPETYGQAGADYIAKQWSTPDDQRIERLTQEAYAKGYLNPTDFEAVARKMIIRVIAGERVTGKACAD